MGSPHELDLRSKAIFSANDAKRFDEIANSIAEEYNSLVEEICIENELEGVALLLSSAFRKTEGLYDLCTRIVFLEEKLKQGLSLEYVLVDDPAVVAAFRQVLDRHGCSRTAIRPASQHQNSKPTLVKKFFSAIKYTLVNWTCFNLFYPFLILVKNFRTRSTANIFRSCQLDLFVLALYELGDE